MSCRAQTRAHTIPWVEIAEPLSQSDHDEGEAEELDNWGEQD